MENTSPFLFDNIDEKFFLAVDGRAVGPLTSQEVYERLQKAEASMLHYLWRAGWADWKRVCDEREFAVLIPQKPTQASIEQIRKKFAQRKGPAKKVQEGGSRNFYLYYSRTQYGPFSREELIHVIQSGKLTRMAYLWTPGWPNWKRLVEIPEFAEALPPTAPDLSKTEEPSVKKPGKGVKKAAAAEEKDRRRAPRRPLVARLFLHNNQEVIIAVCRDISVGGMQVLTDHAPGPVGSTIKLNVSPGDPGKVQSFVAEGEIVRHLEDGRGFSFRFKKITDEARRAIEKYIRTDF